MRVLVLLAVACGTESSPPAQTQAPPPPVAMDAAVADAAALDAATSPPWQFAVLSDLHLPNPRVKDVEQVVAALLEMKVRVVVVTGDHTNGNPGDPVRTFAADGWDDVTRALMPLRKAGIAVLPLAGNHDASTPSQRDHYAQAFRDLDAWAAPFTVTPTADARGHGRPPFSYGVDVEGVHFALTHLVATNVEPDVARWLEADLAAAAGARHRIVFGHVPMSSVIWATKKAYADQLGGIMERGRATLHVAGHEHILWDEDVALPSGSMIRQVLVGCSSGFYQYAPNAAEKLRARCTPIIDATRREPMRCAMPHGGGAFEIARGRKNRHVQHARTTFVVFTVNGDAIAAQPMTLATDGRAVPFYLDAKFP